MAVFLQIQNNNLHKKFLCIFDCQNSNKFEKKDFTQHFFFIFTNNKKYDIIKILSKYIYFTIIKLLFLLIK